MVVLKQCCCGCSLRAGAIIIAIFFVEKAGILLPWVVVQTLLLIAVTAMGIVSCIKAFAVIESTIAGIITVVWVVLYFLLSVYSLVVVYSYYRDLRDNPRPVRLIEEIEDAEM
ncbi:uncharacterized protein LOC126210431 isoform X2 [Schistocerca nitens]|uniref:uncharacterized protein LOC126210431 isoform X2 n=1 Tax=Schistocerca nitens TaxID=7011 RepID=UPI002117589F|nr:uncharacterized protein LOC126210431 isoform X2 [Schistocerca nitens]